MSGAYLWFVTAAYGMSAVSLGALGLWIALDARRVRRRLAALDPREGRR